MNSDCADIEQVLSAAQVVGIAGVERSAMGICRRRNQEVHHPGPQLTRPRDARRELTVAPSDAGVER